MNRLGRQLFARPRFPLNNTAALERAYSKIVCRTCSILVIDRAYRPARNEYAGRCGWIVSVMP